MTVLPWIHLVSSPQETRDEDDGFPVHGSDGIVVTGLAVCWGGKDAYYLSLQKEQKHSGKALALG